MEESETEFQMNRRKKKESCGKVFKILLASTLFVCVLVLSNQATKTMVTNATADQHKLPIYCVDTTEKKIALSFDAAWGAEDFMKIMKILDKHDV